MTDVGRYLAGLFELIARAYRLDPAALAWVPNAMKFLDQVPADDLDVEAQAHQAQAEVPAGELRPETQLSGRALARRGRRGTRARDEAGHGLREVAGQREPGAGPPGPRVRPGGQRPGHRTSPSARPAPRSTVIDGVVPTASEAISSASA